jgi:hypothetical protein
MVGTKDFAGWRWLTIALRTLHLVGVVLVAAGVVARTHPPPGGIALMLVSGIALYGLDLWRHPGHWREVAGAFVAVKLLVLVVMMRVPALAAALFWALLVASSVVSHAPHGFRHRRIIGPRG